MSSNRRARRTASSLCTWLAITTIRSGVMFEPLCIILDMVSLRSALVSLSDLGSGLGSGLGLGVGEIERLVCKFAIICSAYASSPVDDHGVYTSSPVDGHLRILLNQCVVHLERAAADATCRHSPPSTPIFLATTVVDVADGGASARDC